MRFINNFGQYLNESGNEGNPLVLDSFKDKKFKTEYEVKESKGTKGEKGYSGSVSIKMDDNLKEFPYKDGKSVLVFKSNKGDKKLLKFVPWIPDSTKEDVEKRLKKIGDNFESKSLEDQLYVMMNLYYMHKKNK
jgi:hypothetical protein